MFTQCQDSPATGFSKSSTLPQTLKRVDQIVRLFFFRTKIQVSLLQRNSDRDVLANGVHVLQNT